jgi:hypothetical protein
VIDAKEARDSPQAIRHGTRVIALAVATAVAYD